MKESRQQTFVPRRFAALDRLSVFAPAMGSDYSRKRNYDFGPDERGNISMLSPFVRSRLVLEEELVSTALAAHSYEAAEKFIQEVFWRSYWKGWLELRPAVWKNYQRTLEEQHSLRLENPALAASYTAACQGDTPFDCFNYWVEELKTTGYLHNHARMWFASIWIYYLQLPWELGAEFFYRHLLDGDPASNTLSWRWVAGLHTKHKRYIATASNINTYTSQRFNPTNLGQSAEIPLPEDETLHPPIQDYEAAVNRVAGGDAITLLIFDEDLLLENSPFTEAEATRVIGLSPRMIQKQQNLSDVVASFRNSALEDGLYRAGAHFNAPCEILTDVSALEELIRETRENKGHRLGFIRPRVGYWKDLMDRVCPEPSPENQNVVRAERRWDSFLFPYASSGFFRFRKQIPDAIAELISAG